MSVEGFAFFANSLSEPLANFGAVDVVVVDPVFVARVVRRVDGDAFHLAGVVGQERFESEQVVGLEDKVSGAGVAARQGGHILEQVERDFVVVAHHRIFPDPIQRGHKCAVFPTGAGEGETFAEFIAS